MRVRRHSRPAIDPSQRTASPAVPALIGSGSPSRRLLQIGNLLELRQYVGMMLRQMAHHTRVVQQSANIPCREHQIEMVGAIIRLDHPKFSLEILRFMLHQGDLILGQPWRRAPPTLDDLAVRRGRDQ